MPIPDPYSDADKARMIELWQQGLSLSAIAEKMTKESRGRLRLNKNHVKGKLTRMGIAGKNGSAGRPNPALRNHDAPNAKPIQKPKQQVLDQPAPLPAVPQPVRLPVLRPTGNRTEPCAWPTSNGPPWTFCGAPSTAGKPYCPDHCKIAYEGTPRFKVTGY